MRTILASGDSGMDVMHTLYKAYWVDEQDVAQPEVVAQVLQAANLNPEWSHQATEQTIKDELRARTAEAVERGVFGVPTCIVNDEVFWGQDRLDFVEAALRAAA